MIQYWKQEWVKELLARWRSIQDPTSEAKWMKEIRALHVLISAEAIQDLNLRASSILLPDQKDSGDPSG